MEGEKKRRRREEKKKAQRKTIILHCNSASFSAYLVGIENVLEIDNALQGAVEGVLGVCGAFLVKVLRQG
jgi:hypothetical protein